NPDEKMVFDHLTSRGFSCQFEPEGQSKPPDFLVDGKIAVEVRRLNLNYTHLDGSTEGVEGEQIPFRKQFDSVLESFGDSADGSGYAVFYHIYGRPIGKEKEIRKAIREWLLFREQDPDGDCDQIEVSSGLSLRLYRRETGDRLLWCCGGTDRVETIF